MIEIFNAGDVCGRDKGEGRYLPELINAIIC